MPGFVIAIFIILFVLFFSFAVDMALQYLRDRAVAQYLLGEHVCLVLALVAKHARLAGVHRALAG